MANNWIGGPTAPSDPSTFDYDTAAQKVQRQRAAAQALQTMGLQTNQGQFIKSGDFMGYAGGNTLGSTLAHVAAAFLGANANDNADSAQKQLGQDSQSALSYALDPNNAPAAKRAIAAQQQSEADMQLQRESQRGASTTQGGEYQGPQAETQAIQTVPVTAPEQFTPTQMAPAAVQAIAKAPTAPPLAPPANLPTSANGALSPSDIAFASKMLSGAKGQTGSTPAPAQLPQTLPVGQPISATGGPQSFGTGADFSRSLAPTTGANGSLSPNDIAFASRMLSGVPTPSAVSPGRQQNAPQATGVPTSTPALPPMPPQMPAAPALPQQAPTPAPQMPTAPTLEDTARSLGIDPTAQRGPNDPSLAQQVQGVAATQNQLGRGAQTVGDPRSMVDQAAANAQPTTADQIAQLQAIARTGPMGQQLATAQMNSMFGSKVGRYKTTVMADPVNGGFVKVTEDSATGASQTDRIGSPNGTLVTGQTTDANGNRLNVHKDGSTSAMLDASGRPVVDSTVTARNDDQTTKIGAAVQSNTTAQAAIDTALARNQRILQLYTQTETGPIGGHLPNWSAKRQELQALLAQDLFGETRNALAGAGDAGGAPKMAQSEFKYMRDNGGLSQTTDSQTAANIIASMNTQLSAQKQALQGYAQTLKTTAPGAAAPSAPSGVPGRGQTVSAGQWGFK